MLPLPRPPVKQGMRSDDIRHVAEFYAPGAEVLLEFFYRVVATVHEGFITEHPEPLCRLQFGRVGREKVKADALWNLTLIQVPASVIQHQDDPLPLTHPLLLGKGTEQA